MQDLIGNLEGDIVAGEYDIFSKVFYFVNKERYYRAETLAARAI